MIKQCLSVMIMAFTLTACFGPIATPDEHRYTISAMPVSFKHTHQGNAIILVAQPETVATYNTTNMAYTDKPYQVSYYSQNQWAETPSQMFFPLLAQSLEKTGAFKAVVVAPYIGKYDYVINTQLIKVQQNYLNKNAGFFELVVQAQIVRTSTGNVVATRQFTVKTSIGEASPYNGVIAANDAMARALIQLCHFVTTVV